MSVSGMILALFLVEHVVGNVLIYAGRATINGFAATLESPWLVWLVWIVRAVLIVAFLVHVASGITLHLQKRRARPVPYHHRGNVQASVPSRTMIWSGLVDYFRHGGILPLVLAHLLSPAPAPGAERPAAT
jgi:succinate dehydrogenase cytochrome b subunit